MEVELDIFSGRPNPSWQLSPERAAELAAKLQGLSEKTQPAQDPGLGYRGFTLRDGSRTVRIFQGRVTTQSQTPPVTYKDTAGIESDLIAEARKQGYAELVDTIGR